MTKEELKVMVDETINSNGARNITGKALNLALNAIVDSMGTSSGGGNSEDGELKRNDVNFFDYDGTLLYAYTYEEACALTELPPLPVHDELEVREWNYTLEDIKMQGHLGPHDSYVTYEPAGDFDFNGKTYKAYVPVGLTIEDCEFIALCDGEPSEDNLTFLGVGKNGDNDWVDQGIYSFTGLILTGKADVGACVYDSNGEQMHVPGVYIFERGTDNDGITFHISGTVVGVISIPNTVTELNRYIMNSSLCLNELKIPISVTSVDDYYGGAFDGSAIVSSIWWNGVGHDYDFDISSGRTVQLPGNYDVLQPTLSGENEYKCHSNVHELRANSVDNITLIDFTRHQRIPSLTGSCSNMRFVVPDALYEEWINATNWSDIVDCIYKHSDLPWYK